MTYNVFGGMLNLTQPNRCLNILSLVLLDPRLLYSFAFYVLNRWAAGV